MLGLLLLALVLWVALGLDRSRRHRLRDQRSDLAGHHRHRAAPSHRRLRRNGATPAPLTQPVDRTVFLAEVVSGAGPGRVASFSLSGSVTGRSRGRWDSERIRQQASHTGVTQVIIGSELSAEAARELARVDPYGHVVAAQRHAATFPGSRTHGRSASHRSATPGISVPSHVPVRPTPSRPPSGRQQRHPRPRRSDAEAGQV
jgi:hypothetical protein